MSLGPDQNELIEQSTNENQESTELRLSLSHFPADSGQPLDSIFDGSTDLWDPRVDNFLLLNPTSMLKSSTEWLAEPISQTKASVQTSQKPSDSDQEIDIGSSETLATTSGQNALLKATLKESTIVFKKMPRAPSPDATDSSSDEYRPTKKRYAKPKPLPSKQLVQTSSRPSLNEEATAPESDINSELVEQIKKLQTENSQHQELIGALRAIISHSDSGIESLAGHLTKLHENFEELQKVLKRYDSEHQQLQTDYQFLSDTLQEKKKEFQEEREFYELQIRGLQQTRTVTPQYKRVRLSAPRMPEPPTRADLSEVKNTRSTYG